MKNVNWNQIIKESLFIISASILIAIIYNTLNPRGINLLKKPEIVSDTIIQKFLNMGNLTSDKIQNDISNKKDDTLFATNRMGGNQNRILDTLNSAKKKESQIEVGNSNGNNLEIPIVTYKQLVKLLNSPNLILVDARSSENFQQGHIGNAINIFAFENDLNKYFESLTKVPFDKSKIIIVYCEGGSCDASHKVATDLIRLGYQNVFVYAGGWEEWLKNKN